MAMALALRRLSSSSADKPLQRLFNGGQIYSMASLPSEAVYEKERTGVTWPKQLNAPLEVVDPEIADIIELEKARQWKVNSLPLFLVLTVMLSGETIPLEYNLVGLNAISFNKGCYVGQELIARSHHRGVIRKRLLPLKFLNESGNEAAEQKVGPGSEVIASKSGKKVGTVTTALGSRGLGLIRLDEAFPKGPGKLVIKGQEDVTVEPTRPEWWPTEWFLEHQPHQAGG